MDTLNTLENAYDFSFATLVNAQPLPLISFKDKVLLIVNTASQCGFTPQFTELETLYQTYKDQGLVIIGVPSNDFGNQEPGTDEEIAYFCKTNYGVTFIMTSKEKITGEAGHPFYKWALETLGPIGAPKWNFHKYLVDRRGNLVQYFYSATSPNNETVKEAIEKALADI